MIDFTGVDSENIPYLWGEIEPLIISGLDYVPGHTHTSEDIYDALMRKTMQLWIASEDQVLLGCTVTKIFEQPQATVCTLVVTAGEQVERWEHNLSVVEDWAYSQGCSLMQHYGRLGWSRMAKRHGYKRSSIYTKTLRSTHENTH